MGCPRPEMGLSRPQIRRSRAFARVPKPGYAGLGSCIEYVYNDAGNVTQMTWDGGCTGEMLTCTTLHDLRLLIARPAEPYRV